MTQPKQYLDHLAAIVPVEQALIGAVMNSAKDRISAPVRIRRRPSHRKSGRNPS